MAVTDILEFVTRFLNRKERCRLRAVSRDIRDLVEKPRPMKQLWTHPFANIKMILNLGKTLGHVITITIGNLKHTVVCYKDYEFNYAYMCTLRFMKTPIARMFFMAYKFREYDSKLIEPWESFQWKYQLKPKRALRILEATPDQIKSVVFLASA